MKIKQLKYTIFVTGVLVLAAFSIMSFQAWHQRDVELLVAKNFEPVSLEGRRETLQLEISRLKSTSAVDRWLEAQEENINHHLKRRGAEIKKSQRKGVVWADKQLQSEVSIVYVHGFSASRLELDPVVSDLARRLGANVFFTRLSAHGLADGEDFATVQASDWAEDVEEAMAIGQHIGRRVFIIAMSTGVPLVVENLLRSGHIKSRLRGVAGLILLSPNYEPATYGTFLIEGSNGTRIARQLFGDHREFLTTSPMHADRWTAKYRIEGLNAMMTAVASVRRLDFRKLTIPVLTLFTSYDEVVSVSEIKRRSREFVTKGSRVVDWSIAVRHELSSATFNPENIPALNDIIYSWVTDL